MSALRQCPKKSPPQKILLIIRLIKNLGGPQSESRMNGPAAQRRRAAESGFQTNSRTVGQNSVARKSLPVPAQSTRPLRP